jgi:multidrug efflux pump subunit AcrB
VAVAVLVSLFVSFTHHPMLSAIWRDPPGTRFKRVPWLGKVMAKVESGVEWAHERYGELLEWALGHRKTVLAIALAVFVSSFFVLPLVGTEFVPESDEGRTSFRLTTPVGSSLEYTDAKTRQVEDILRGYPEVEFMTSSVGTGEGRNVARVEVRLVDRHKAARPSQKDFEASVRDKIRKIPGIELAVGYNRPIWINLLGPGNDELERISNETLEKMAKIKGITDLESSLKANNPAITMKVNNELASDLGLTVSQIGAAVRPFVAGDVISYWLAPDGQNYEVNVQLPKGGRRITADLGELYVVSSKVSADGAPILVPLRQVVEFKQTTSPQIIKRQDLQRRVGLYANVEGRPSGDVGREVEELIKGIQLPPGYRFDIAGQQQDMNDSFMAAVAALGMAVIFIYIILASQFGSFLQPLAIMASLPFTLIGVFLALLVTGSTLNIFSIIGIIMLMGLVTKNAILLVDFTNQGLREGKSRHDAILAAGQVRLRPILMTTLAMIFGMLPMAIGSADGGEQNAPMGRAVIGGIITSTLLTLVVVPVLFTYLDAWGQRFKAWFTAGDEEDLATHAGED